MLTQNRFQYRVATGKGTLPVATLFTLILWGITFLHDFKNIGSLFFIGLAAYLLLEANTQFALIRTRTSLPSSLFLFFSASMLFLQTKMPICMLPALFMLMLFGLFKSYESKYASTTIFHAFLWISISSLIVPCIIWIVPLLFIHMIGLRSLTGKTFFAGLIGLGLPYWFLFAYSLYANRLEWFRALMGKPFQFLPIDYTQIAINQWISYGITLVLLTIYIFLYTQSAYKDKVQTRIYLQATCWIGCWICILMFLQPQYINALLPIVLLVEAILGAHLFALTYNRITRILFYFTLFSYFAICSFNVWMHFFSY